MAVSRMTSRKKIAALLAAEITEASEVLAYQPANIGATPGIYIRSTSADRPPLTVRGKIPVFQFDIIVLVLQADPGAAPPWTEAKAEDLLDAIEAKICDVLTGNRRIEGYWNVINYTHASDVMHFYEEGVAYLLETIPIQVEAY